MKNVARRVGEKLFSQERVWQYFGPQANLDEIRQAAFRICRDYLNGRWKTVPADELIVKRISGGLSNYLYYVSLPKLDNSNENADGRALGLMEVCLEGTKANNLLTTDKNENDPQCELMSSAVDDLNANKRKKRNSSSSTASLALTENEPEEVLLRVYGQSHGEDALEAMITESVVFALLSERHFGPKLHGIFPGGRIEQYIPARALLTSELSDSKISMKIAEKMGEIHSLNIPMSKEPDWPWNCMNRWQRNLPAILNRNDWKDNQAHAEHIRNINYVEEIKWFKSVINQGQYPVLFCHNDMQEGNILLRGSHNVQEANANDLLMEHSNNDGDDLINKKPTILERDFSRDLTLRASDAEEPDLMIIDFEYCAYNYRGFDLANHFVEWTINYSNPTFPFFHHWPEKYPSREQRHQFIRAYLKKLKDCADNWEPSQKEIDDVDNEVKIFRLFSHLFWSLWSVVNVTSNIEFGYWDYAVCRINEYLKLKQDFIAESTAQA